MVKIWFKMVNRNVACNLFPRGRKTKYIDKSNFTKQ